MTRIVSTIRIHRDADIVFDFFTTPKNAPKWHPASLSVGGAVDHSLAVDEEFSEELTGPAGMRGHAKWRVVASDAPHLWRIELKESKPVRMTALVTLRFHGEPGETMFERHVHYRYAQPWLVVLDALFLRRRNEREGRECLRRAKQILEEARS